jgi:hypothetical protein
VGGGFEGDELFGAGSHFHVVSIVRVTGFEALSLGQSGWPIIEVTCLDVMPILTLAKVSALRCGPRKNKIMAASRAIVDGNPSQ